jgi:hypothetical protein
VSHYEASVSTGLTVNLDNSSVTLHFFYLKEAGMDALEAALSISGFGTLQIEPASLYLFPVAIQDAYTEFTEYVAEYDTDVLVPYAMLALDWTGIITEGAPLQIDTYVAVEIEYLEGVYYTPHFVWMANNYDFWLNAWPDPSFNGIFPSATHMDLEDIFGFQEEDFDQWGP